MAVFELILPKLMKSLYETVQFADPGFGALSTKTGLKLLLYCSTSSVIVTKEDDHCTVIESSMEYTGLFEKSTELASSDLGGLVKKETSAMTADASIDRQVHPERAILMMKVTTSVE